jgi:molybdate transport system regulatory protein
VLEKKAQRIAIFQPISRTTANEVCSNLGMRGLLGHQRRGLESIGKPAPLAAFEESFNWIIGSMRNAPRKNTRRAATLKSDLRQAALTIRIDFGAHGYLGPGKIALMELISKYGSISAAGKDMGMSYRRAWLLVDEINQIFREPLVEKKMGGSGGGGARLTKLGRDIVGRYRAIEGAAATASAAELRALKASLPPRPAHIGGED